MLNFLELYLYNFCQLFKYVLQLFHFKFIFSYQFVTLLSFSLWFTPEKPTYTQIAEWRKVLARLVQFLRLVDMQVMELLRRLVKTSMRHLLEFMNASACVIGEEVVCEVLNYFIVTSLLKCFITMHCFLICFLHLHIYFCILEVSKKGTYLSVPCHCLNRLPSLVICLFCFAFYCTLHSQVTRKFLNMYIYIY